MRRLGFPSQENYLRVIRRPLRALIFRRLVASVASLVLLLVMGACEKPTAENLDKWRNTEKGPGKLQKALENGGLSPELRGHAARNLIQLRKDEQVFRALAKIGAAKKAPVVASLVNWLWQDARLKGALSQPSPGQVAAKDALFELRPHAEGDTLVTLDKYLVEWFTGGYYEGRAAMGRFTGARVMRAVGPAGVRGMLDVVNAIVATPKAADGTRPKLTRRVLLGLAATGSPEGVKRLLDLSSLDLGDPKLHDEALMALYAAYVKPEDFDKVDGAALKPHVSRLVGLIRKEESLAVVDALMPVLSAAGKPECVKPLIDMVVDPPPQSVHFRWVATQRAMLCGGLEAAPRVVAALPPGGRYSRARLEGSVWSYLMLMRPVSKVAEMAQSLLSSRSWVARITGIEVLAKLRDRSTAASAAAAVGTLANDRTLLKGWWGDQSELPKKKRKKTPRLGQRAAAVAKQLQELANGPKK